MAVKEAVVEPEETVIEAGTETEALLSERAMVRPPEGAGAERVRVQVALPGVSRAVGVQARPAGVMTVMAPPVAAMEAAVPSGRAAAVLPMAMAMGTEVLLVTEPRVTVTMAMTPLAMVLAFMPAARHTDDPLRAAQVSVLFAAVRAGPATTLTDVTSPGAYESVHCKPEGILVAAAVQLRFRDDVPPGAAAPEERAKEFVCPSRTCVDRKRTTADSGTPAWSSIV